MADREQSGAPKPGKERERAGTSGGTVGRDVPDMSKERNTEIAVEAGRKDKEGERRDDKR